MSDYPISNRQARKRLAHKERLRAGMSATYDMAQRWYLAHQAIAPAGGNSLSFGCVAQTLLTVTEGQKNLIRWHDGTHTMMWVGGRHFETGEWIVARTVWNDATNAVYTAERLMHVTELLDVMPVNAQSLYEDYWRYSRELDELEMTSLLMIAPIDQDSKRVSTP
jgi:hypothetical protein